MNEQVSEINEEEKLAELFRRVEGIFNKLDHETDDDRRIITTTDGDVVLNRISTSAQDAFLVTVGDFFYYLSKGGVEYVRVGDIKLDLGNSDKVAPLRNSYQEIQPEDKLKVTEKMVRLTEWAFNYSGFRLSPHLPKAKFVGDIRS